MNRGSLQCCTNPARACFRPGMSRSLGYLPRLARVSKNNRKNAIRRAERNPLRRDSRQTTWRPWRHTRRSATSKRCGISSPLRDRAGKAKNRRRRQGRARSATGVDLIHRRSRRSAIFRCVCFGAGKRGKSVSFLLSLVAFFGRRRDAVCFVCSSCFRRRVGRRQRPLQTVVVSPPES